MLCLSEDKLNSPVIFGATLLFKPFAFFHTTPPPCLLPSPPALHTSSLHTAHLKSPNTFLSLAFSPQKRGCISCIEFLDRQIRPFQLWCAKLYLIFTVAVQDKDILDVRIHATLLLRNKSEKPPLIVSKSLFKPLEMSTSLHANTFKNVWTKIRVHNY